MTIQVPDSVIGRAAALLRSVAAAGTRGATTTEVAKALGLARPTVHRLLTELQREGFTDRERRSSRWLVGPELYLLGRQAAERYDVTAPARAVVHRLAEASGESAFFSARRGDETVCLLRQDGSFPIRSFVLYEGARFPLGVVSAGIVVLAFLSDRFIDDYLDRAELAPAFGETHSAAAVRRRIADTRSAGFSVNPGLIVPGSWGMAAAVFDDQGEPAWALSLTGVESRFGADRRPELGAMLLHEAHRLTLDLRARGRRLAVQE